MLAAEHGGLAGGKVGGIGDVIEQLPPALVAAGAEVDVLLPSYGVYHRNEGSKLIAESAIDFAGSQQTVGLYRLPSLDGAGCWVIHHPVFSAPAGQIYHHDPDDQPFATDANIYALFCAAAAEMLTASVLAKPDVVHLHDWHAATFAVLARASKTLSSLKLVYTIHNLALQGTRPLSGHPSSFASWFPKFAGEFDDSKDYLRDPRYSDCYNPTRAALLLVDKVHVVSPTYAQEILQSNNPAAGSHGGEGLEFDLQSRHEQGDVVGILNGCEYSADADGQTAAVTDATVREREVFARAIQKTLATWIGSSETLRASDFLARDALEMIRPSLAGRFLLTSVGRVTQQKVGLLLHSDESRSSTLLDRLLTELGDAGCIVMLGSGDADLESQLVEHAARHNNFLFLRGFSEQLAEAIYAIGDLFLMPSLFEPCGISQLLAMRSGQPCLAHATGGLRDTITDGVDGLLFDGANLHDKAMNCEQALKRALRLRTQTEDYLKMRTLAAKRRVTWQRAANEYLSRLYIP